MTILLQLLAQPLPEGAPTDDELAAGWFPWKLKKRVAAILHRFLSRYGNPNRKSQGAMSDGVAKFATFFQVKRVVQHRGSA